MKIAPWSLIIIIIRKVRDAVCSWCPAVCPVLSSSAGREGEMFSCQLLLTEPWTQEAFSWEHGDLRFRKAAKANERVSKQIIDACSSALCKTLIKETVAGNEFSPYGCWRFVACRWNTVSCQEEGCMWWRERLSAVYYVIYYYNVEKFHTGMKEGEATTPHPKDLQTLHLLCVNNNKYTKYTGFTVM